MGKAELVYRRRIAAEAGTDGAFGVDNRYLLAQADIHQPLLDEQGRSAPDRWELHRARTMVVVPIPDVDDPQSVREAAVEIAKAALGPFAGELMLCLYAIANDPPNWRNPAFTVSLNDLLDRMGYVRDAQGRHYSVNRRQISSTLLALHLTHVGIRHENAGRQQQAVVAPLLESVGYQAGEETQHLNIMEVFAQGLPDRVGVRIHQLWYDGLRSREGRPGVDYTLIPRVPSHRGRSLATARSLPQAVLREYLSRCQLDLHGNPLVIARDRLIAIAGIQNTRTGGSNRALAKELDRLCAEGMIGGYEPKTLPTQPDAAITISWVTPIAQTRLELVMYADPDNTRLIQILESFLAQIGDVGSNLFLSQFGVAGHAFELFDVDGGVAVVLDQLLGDEDGVLEIVPTPRHEGDQHVLTERQLPHISGGSVGNDIAAPNMVADFHHRPLIDTGILVRSGELYEIVNIDTGAGLIVFILINLDDDPRGVHRFHHSIVPCHHRYAGIPCHNSLHAGADDWRICPRRGTAWRCMLDPISARLASSFSRKGIREAATETSCMGATSISSSSSRLTRTNSPPLRAET